MKIVSAVASILLIAACSSNADDVQSPAPLPEPTTDELPPEPTTDELPPDPTAEPEAIRCDDDISGSEPPPEGFDVIDDIVALPSLDAPALQLGQAVTISDTAWFFAKTGLVVQGGVKVELRVPDNHSAELLIGWGHSADPGTVVVVDGCPAGRWLAFAGGYWVQEPGCYRVEVRVDDGAWREHSVGLGAPCDGQQSPEPNP